MANLLVEFLNDDNSDNISPFTFCDYDEAAYLYFSTDNVLPSTVKSLSDFISKKFRTNISFIKVEDESVDSAYKALSALFNNGDSVTVDVTGGNELFSAAAGMLISEKTKGLTVIFHGEDRMKEQVTYPENLVREAVRTFSADELIGLSEGCVISVKTRYSDFKDNGDLRGEVLKMWAAVKSVFEEWNKFCALPYCECDNGYKRKLNRDEEKKFCKTVTDAMKKNGIFKDVKYYTDTNGRSFLEYKLYKGAKTVEMYEKSGTALEYYTCLAFGECGAFSDAETGINLDLNGVILKDNSDPRNEIDAAAVYRNKLVLISCKNNQPTKEYLYEVMSLCSHYGGNYAVPVLVSSDLALEITSNRAEEMKVMLIDNVSSLTFPQFKEKIRLCFKRTE